jgi:hypothetical protein
MDDKRQHNSDLEVCMNSKRFWRLATIGVVVLAVGISALAQTSTPTNLRGVINDYTPAGSSGPWEVRGQWSLHVNGLSGMANFSAALTMVRSDLGVMVNGGGDLNSPVERNAHTHHITVVNGTVTPLANGFRVSGTATITGNGNFPPPFGSSSTLQIDIVGGNTVAFSNIKLTFGGDAAGHFGTQAVNGVVRKFE